MILLVGGGPWSGAAVLARRLWERRGVAPLPLDALRAALAAAAPPDGAGPAAVLTIGQDARAAGDADRLRRAAAALAAALADRPRGGVPYCLEGAALGPRDAARLAAGRPPGRVRAVFLARVGPDARALAASPRPPPPAVRLALAEDARRADAWRHECARLGLPFFDTGPCFEGALARAEESLFAGG